MKGAVGHEDEKDRRTNSFRTNKIKTAAAETNQLSNP